MFLVELERENESNVGCAAENASIIIAETQLRCDVSFFQRNFTEKCPSIAYSSRNFAKFINGLSAFIIVSLGFIYLFTIGSSTCSLSSSGQDIISYVHDSFF